MRLLVAITIALLASGCSRGCASRVVSDGQSSPLDLGGVDCSDGLARCVGAAVYVSSGGHVPSRCGTPGAAACACPWREVGTCARGCVREGLEVLAPPEVALEQLCAADENVVGTTHAEQADTAPICADEGVSCVSGRVWACLSATRVAQLAGTCAFGCAQKVSLDPAELLTGDGTVAILCRRRRGEER